MKRSKFNEIKTLDNLALFELAKKARTEISDLILDKNMSKLKDLKSITKKRKDLSQILTVLAQKQLLVKLEEKIGKESQAKLLPTSESTEEGSTKTEGSPKKKGAK